MTIFCMVTTLQQRRHIAVKTDNIMNAPYSSDDTDISPNSNKLKYVISAIWTIRQDTEGTSATLNDSTWTCA